MDDLDLLLGKLGKPVSKSVDKRLRIVSKVDGIREPRSKQANRWSDQSRERKDA
jgi:hypothetical protein